MSAAPLRRALLSFVTLFGGHFLNRRLDRVVLIGVLVAAAVIASARLIYALHTIEPYLFYPAALKVSWLPLILLAPIALLSAILTFRDAGRVESGSLTITTRVIRLPLTVVGTLVLAAAVITTRISPTTWSYLQLETTVATVGHLDFGHGDDTVAIYSFHGDAPRPPEGPYPLRGRITLDNAGLEGAGITLMINGAETTVLYSNSRGEFEVSLPAGKWRVNEVTVSDWDDRPRNRHLLLFSSYEPLKRPGLYSRGNLQLWEAGGIEVSLPAASNAIPVQLELRDALRMTWPPPRGPGEHRDRAGVLETDDLQNSAIAWQPVKGASEYEVQISHVMADGDDFAVRYPWLYLTRRVSGMTLPLASLPQRQASAPADQYSVHVFAFDAAGRLLTESNVESEDRSFRLTGSSRLGREQQYVGFQGPVQVISLEYERNEAQLDKAKDLMSVRRFEDARTVLDGVTKDAPPGRALALRGRLAALQGDCKTALKLFDEADKEVGGDCASNEDRKLCETP
jgi:hypothetical protein